MEEVEEENDIAEGGSEGEEAEESSEEAEAEDQDVDDFIIVEIPVDVDDLQLDPGQSALDVSEEEIMVALAAADELLSDGGNATTMEELIEAKEDFLEQTAAIGFTFPGTSDEQVEALLANLEDGEDLDTEPPTMNILPMT